MVELKISGASAIIIRVGLAKISPAISVKEDFEAFDLISTGITFVTSLAVGTLGADDFFLPRNNDFAVGRLPELILGRLSSADEGKPTEGNSTLSFSGIVPILGALERLLDTDW